MEAVRGWSKERGGQLEVGSCCSWLPARNDDRFPTSWGKGISSTCRFVATTLRCTVYVLRYTLLPVCGLLWPRAANYVLTVNASVNWLTIRFKLSGIFLRFSFYSFSFSLCSVSDGSKRSEILQVNGQRAKRWEIFTNVTRCKRLPFPRIGSGIFYRKCR